jgi:FAD/FMN-containing dehydrogenase
MQRRDFCTRTLLAGATASVPAIRLLAAAADGINTDVPAVTLSGETTVLTKSALESLARGLRGDLLLATDAGYDSARRLWNAMIDRHPAVIVRCSGAADVARAVNFSREHDLLIAVRSGGHSFPGKSSCDQGLVIDLSRLRYVDVDVAARTARVAAGALGADVDREAQFHGLATTLGTVSDTGVAGLALGGGFGWLSRRLGLACDNLLAVEIVTADGRIMHASATQNPDLFWAVRGGGGNFGVVTEFTCQLHPIGPQVYAGYVTYPLSRRREALELYARLAVEAPREANIDFGLETSPAGQLGAHLYLCHTGSESSADALAKRLRSLGQPMNDTLRRMPYLEWQSAFDGPSPSPFRNYLKSGFVTAFDARLVDYLAGAFEPLPSFALGAYSMHAGGAIGDVAPTGTAFAHRDALANVMVYGGWADAGADQERVAAIRAAWERVEPYTRGFYVNLNDAAAEPTRSNYGPNLARLAAVKKRYDPHNRFRLNANVQPA